MESLPGWNPTTNHGPTPGIANLALDPHPRRRRRSLSGHHLSIVTFLSQPAVRRGRFADAGTPQSVGVKTITRGDIRLVVNALGAVTPLTTVTVNTQISGLLMEVGFKEGQLVHKGQFLAQIDPRPYQVALEQDQAQLARDEATLKQAQMDLERYKTLADQTSIARQTYEDQVWVVKQNQGHGRLRQGANQGAAAQSRPTAASSRRADGRVGLRLVDPGNFVQTTSTTGIVVLTQLNPISVVFRCPRTASRKSWRGCAGAKLPVTAFDRANVKQLAVGEFAAIDNEVDTTTGTVRCARASTMPRRRSFRASSSMSCMAWIRSRMSSPCRSGRAARGARNLRRSRPRC
jgi:membrane fusion protein, multidrug efflux system